MASVLLPSFLAPYIALLVNTVSLVFSLPIFLWFMGSCVSSAASDAAAAAFRTTPTAKVITLSGSLKEYSFPVKSSIVLGDPSAQTQPSFLCNSNKLYYNRYIPALDPEEPILPGELYFVLPVQKLEEPLTGPDMAALATRATSALMAVGAGTGKGRRGKKFRVIPVFEMVEDGEFGDDDDDGGGGGMSMYSSTLPPPASREKKMATWRRSGSMRVRINAGSFRSRLSTIEESPEESLS